MAEQIKNWYDRRDAWLYEQTKAGAWVQPPRDQYRDVMYILHLEAENDALRERLKGSVSKDSVANMLKELFDSPCNFSPLDEEMYDYCDECMMDDVACWKKVIDKKCKEA